MLLRLVDFLKTCLALPQAWRFCLPSSETLLRSWELLKSQPFFRQSQRVEIRAAAENKKDQSVHVPNFSSFSILKSHEKPHSSNAQKSYTGPKLSFFAFLLSLNSNNEYKVKCVRNAFFTDKLQKKKCMEGKSTD